MQRNTVVVGIVLSLMLISAVAVVVSDEADGVPASKVTYTEDGEIGTIAFVADNLSPDNKYSVQIIADVPSAHLADVVNDQLVIESERLSGLEGEVEYTVYTYDDEGQSIVLYDGTFIAGTVTLHANGGDGDDVSYSVGGMYALPDCSFDAPEGKTFGGWSYTTSGSAITADEIEITGDVDLYAVWVGSGVEPDKVDIGFECNKAWGTLSQDTLSAGIGAEITVDGATVTIEGAGSVTATANDADPDFEYGFVEWQVNGEKYKGGTVEDAMTIVAVFDRTPVEPEPEPEPVTGVEIEDIGSIRYGQSVDLDYTVNPTGAPVSSVVWTSNNPEVISVNDGKITAVGTGSATITVTVTGAEGGTATDSVTIDVDAKVTDVWFLEDSTRYDDSVVMGPGETLVLDVTGDAPIQSVTIDEIGDIITASVTGTTLSIIAGETLGDTAIKMTVTDTEDNQIAVTLDVTVTTVYLVSVEIDGSGSVAYGNSELSDNGYFRVDAGTDAVLYFDPSMGYALGEVLLDGIAVEIVDNSLTIPAISDHHSVKVTFTYVGIVDDDDDDYVPPDITVVTGDDDDSTTYIVAIAAAAVVAILAALILMQTRKS